MWSNNADGGGGDTDYHNCANGNNIMESEITNRITEKKIMAFFLALIIFDGPDE